MFRKNKCFNVYLNEHCIIIYRRSKPYQTVPNNKYLNECGSIYDDFYIKIKLNKTFVKSVYNKSKAVRFRIGS